MRISAACMCAALALASPPLAVRAQTAVGVSGNVVQGCDITLTSPTITLSNYDFATFAGQDDTASENGNVTCGTGTAADISFGSDTSPDSPYTLTMSGPGPIVVKLTATYTAAASGMPFTITADAPAGQNPVAGSYTGSTTVNVDFY